VADADLMPPPLVSILTPVYDTDTEVLTSCVESVLAQTHQRWELCLVDDGSPSAHVWPLLQRLSDRDPRIRIRRRQQNGGIVAASNDAFAMASGSIVSLLDHDDLLHRRALWRVVSAFADPEVDYVYTDEDVVEVDGRRRDPFYKPDWSPERFRAQMYTCHLSSLRREVIDRVGGFREGFEGSQDWDLIFRVTEVARKIVHIPEVLYHWRAVETSVLAGQHVKPYAYESAIRAIAAHCERVGIEAEVQELEQRGHFRLLRKLPDPPPTVSVVIPTRGTRGRVWGVDRSMVLEAVRSVVERSTYRPHEFVVVADAETPEEVKEQLELLIPDRLKWVRWDAPFDFSAKCNLGAAHSTGELLLFLNDDVEVITPAWLGSMVAIAVEPDVGSVGAHLLFEDGRLQHGGHVIVDGAPGHLCFGGNPEGTRNRMALHLDREVTGVTAACLLIRRDVFDDVGGFSSEFPNNYNDVDLALKIRGLGLRTVVTPQARLYHFESASRNPTVSDVERQRLVDRWGPELRDPYYNPSHPGGLDDYSTPTYYP